MEDALARKENRYKASCIEKVLILVLMEDALARSGRRTKRPLKVGLNPCSNGRCTRTGFPEFF